DLAARLCRWGCRGSERELEALVRLRVAEPTVEPVRVRPLLVRRELRERAPAGPASLVRVLHHPGTDALAAQLLVHPHGLGQQPRRSVAGDARDERELHDADHRAVDLGDDELVVGAGRDRLEPPHVRLPVGAGTAGGDGVVGDELDDALEVGAAGFAEGEVHGATLGAPGAASDRPVSVGVRPYDPVVTADPPAPVPRSSWVALAVLILGVSMALLDTTIVNVALPTIRTSLDASEGTLSWTISGYALAYGLALIPSGRVGDRVGHKWVFVVGLAGFTLASLWCGTASGAAELILARVVQGLCGGIFFPAVTALIQLMFTGRTRGKAFAVMGAAIGFSTALGPLIGGLLIEAFGEQEGWRSIFFVNLPFGVIAVAAAAALLPRIVVGGGSRGVDLFGLLLVT